MTSTDTDQTHTLHTLVPFAKTLGIRVLCWTPRWVRARMAWTVEGCTAGGMLHGGAIMTLADTTGAACAYANLPDGAAGTTTVESKSNFFRGVSRGHIDAISQPLHLGRSIIAIETDVIDSDGCRIARVGQSQAVLYD